MGSSFEFGIVDADPDRARQLLELGIVETQRIEDTLTEFKPDSITSQINANAGIKELVVSKEVYDLLNRSLNISKLTNGYFDITVGPLKRLYKFKNNVFSFPPKKDIKSALQKVGYQKIQLETNKQTAFLETSDMYISFAAIGKGYAADAVRNLWKEHGAHNGYINASGDLTAFGTNEKGDLWKIGIADPDHTQNMLFYVPLDRASVATSGDYEQHFMYKGKRYSHNINPKTGMPLSGIKSVSVFSPSAELSDALATAVYTMGVEKGLSFLNQLPKTHGIIIDDQNNVYFSKKLQYEAAS